MAHGAAAEDSELSSKTKTMVRALKTLQQQIEIEIEAWDMRVGDEADNSFGGACRRESECAITLAHHCLAYLRRVADTASLFSTHRARRQARQVRNARIGCDGEERCRL